MNERIRRAGGENEYGYTAIAEMNGRHADMKMDFGVLRMRAGEEYEDERMLERAYLLVYGRVRLEYGKAAAEVSRANCFDEPPVALHLPRGVRFRAVALSEDCELDALATENDTDFSPRLYRQADTPDEYRGAGFMKETSTRIVRTVFDFRNAPWANLVLGEVIGFPGKWSSYPPHHHPQPEIYYYKTNPKNGFAYAELGDDVVKVRENDAVFIAPGLTHPQCTPPGYALWYLWAIRHLPGQPYGTPVFLPEHLWVQEKGAAYWPERKGVRG